MRRIRSARLAGVTAAVALGAGTVAAQPAYADSDYTLHVRHGGWFVANFCLSSQSYDASRRDTRTRCTGNKGVGRYRLSVSHRDGYRVWLDVKVVAGTDANQVTMHNGWQFRVNDHVFNTRECEINDSATTLVWVLHCKRDAKPSLEEYWAT